MLMSITQAAMELGVSPTHIRKMIKQGLWPSYSLGKKAVRVDVDEIRALGKLIAESKRGTPDGNQGN